SKSSNSASVNRERSTTVIGSPREVPLRMGCTVTSKTVPAESIDDINGPSFANLRSILRYVEVEELPIMRCGVEALIPLDHGLGRNQLNDGSRRIRSPPRRIGGGKRRLEIALQVVHVELTDRCHLRDTPK